MVFGVDDAIGAASLASSVFGKGKKKSSGSSTQVVQNEPPAYLQPYLKDIAGRASGAYQEFLNKGYNNPYAGVRTVGANANDTAADEATRKAMGDFAGVADRTYGMADYLGDKVTSGGYQAPGNMAFDVEGNRYTDDMINASLTPVLRKWQEQTLPGLKSAAISGGAYGGSKQQEFDSQAYRDTQQQVADIASGIKYKDFDTMRTLAQTDLNQRRALLAQGNNTELNASGQVANLGNSALAQGLQIPQLLQTLADKERGFAQGTANDAQALYAEQQQSPFAGLDWYSAIISGQNKGGTATTTSQGPKQTNFLNGLGALQSFNQQTGYGDQALDWIKGLFK